MWLRTGQLANRVQDIAHVYRCAVIMPEGGSIWELYHGFYLGYKPNQDINFRYTCTPTSFLQEVYMKFIHLLLSNLIGQNVQAMVQVIYSPPILQPDWSEVTSHRTKRYNNSLWYDTKLYTGCSSCIRLKHSALGPRALNRIHPSHPVYN